MRSIIEEHRASCSRRSLLRKVGAGMAGISLAHMIGSSIEDQIAFAAEGVNRSSAPSQLRITDLRLAVVVGSPMRCPIIRIDTNQGISGYGEVRDGASERYALMLKNRIMNQNPCNIELIFKKLKQFGGQARQGGGVSGIEMALWDLAGKAYGVPVYQLLGGKYRDRVRLYADTPGGNINGIKERLAKGFTFLKMDVGINLVANQPGTAVYPEGTIGGRGRGGGGGGRGGSGDFPINQTKHPFTGIALTDKGAQLMAERFGQAREAAGSVPIGSDHFGQISVKSCIKLANAFSKYQPAWMEDMIPWEYTDLLREIKTSIDVPLLTGEDIYLLENFKPLIDAHAVDYIQPDLATAGGILETKRIGDYAEEHGIPMVQHCAATPICMMANVHCAAATQNSMVLEHHGVDVSYWEDMVIGIEKPFFQQGYVRVPETPGLGVEPNPDVIKAHLERGQEYFGPTDNWNGGVQNDALWS
jgi:L-alanine-DL-glutamate epimerase-like enolase superfamily enzyme